jgi:hypothetical protein
MLDVALQPVAEIVSQNETKLAKRVFQRQEANLDEAVKDASIVKCKKDWTEVL